MKNWGYAIISIGCLLIASAPLTNQTASMIGIGLIIAVMGMLMVFKKKPLNQRRK